MLWYMKCNLVSITSNLTRRVLTWPNMAMCGYDLRTFLHLFSTEESNEILMTELIWEGFIPLNMIPAIGHELTSRSLWSNSETWPPWEGGGQTRSQQCKKTRGDLEQSQYMARCGHLPAEVLPALPAAHPRPVAARM